MEKSSYKGKVKKIYDTGYGITLNIYDKALKVWVGGTVDSKATAIKRRGKGCTVAFEATLAGTEGQEKAKMAAFVSPAELVTSINEASVAVLTPAEQQVFSSFAPKATEVAVEKPTVKAESTQHCTASLANNNDNNGAGEEGFHWSPWHCDHPPYRHCHYCLHGWALLHAAERQTEATATCTRGSSAWGYSTDEPT